SGPAGGGGDATRITVREPATGRVRVNAVVPEDCGLMWFSGDGDFLFVRGDSGVHVIDTSTGRRCPPQPGAEAFAVIPGIRQVLALDRRQEDRLSLVRRDFDAGSAVGRLDLPPGFTLVSYPYEDGRHLLLVGNDPSGPFARVRKYLANLPLVGRAFAVEPTECAVYDTATEREVARIHPTAPVWTQLSPDGRTLVNASRNGQLECWDVPPRKPLTWFVAAACVWAVPVLWLARRRTR
ncbi:MAG TPA: hypothetical protein VGF55_01685, partial [Gemmataceae bacterium]